MKTLLSRRFEAGSYSEEWDGRDDRGRMMASGIYYFDMIVDASKVETRSAVMLK